MAMSKQKFTREEKKAYAKQRTADDADRWFNQLEQAIVNNELPWQKPWAAGTASMPTNIKSKKRYRGSNIISLMIGGWIEGWTDLRFGTYKQLIDADYSIKGLKRGTGQLVKFVKEIVYENENDDGEIEKKKVFYAQYSEVFCVEQCQNYEPPKHKHEPVPESEMMKHFNKFVEDQAITLERKGSRAFYSSKKDYIGLPSHESFTDSLGEVMTAFHEAGHATGHKDRLNRPLGNGFGSADYAFEELIAEMSSMLTVLSLGGDFVPDLVNEEGANSQAYLKNWLKACKDRDNALSLAFSNAQKASDFILKSIEGVDEE